MVASAWQSGRGGYGRIDVGNFDFVMPDGRKGLRVCAWVDRDWDWNGCWFSDIGRKGGGEQEMSDFPKAYVLLQRKNRQIVIIDNATHIGKKKVEREISEGSKYVGRIVDTPLSSSQLRGGFSTYERERREELQDKIWKAIEDLQ